MVTMTYAKIPILKLERTDRISVTRNRDNPRTHSLSGLHNLGPKQSGQQKMTQMIDSELRLNTIFRQGVLLDRHHTSIVNQIVNLVHNIVDLRRSPADGLETVEVDGHKDRGNRGVDFVDLVDHGLNLGGVAGEKDQSRRVAAGEGRGGFCAETVR